MLTATDLKLAQYLDQHHGVIMKTGTDAYPAYAKGDRRKRPICWVSQDSFKALSSFGGIQEQANGFGLVKSFARRCRAGGDFARQHRNIKEEEVYLRSGVERAARINRSLSVMDRLYQRRDKTGKTLLSEAQYEAGRRFARDYALAHHDDISTQNYFTAGADKPSGHYANVERLDRRIDASKRLERARACIGAGLEKAVIAVCCRDTSLDELERVEAWSVSSGLTVLKLGLSALADHYGTQAGR